MDRIETSEQLLYLSAFLFSIGLMVLITRRNTIMMLIGIELMLNAANLNLVIFNSPQQLDGQIFALFIIIVAVCEAAVGMAIILRMYHHYHTSLPDQIRELKEKP
jgi:NADH:ubiquinone oxidoreductase subunit K